MLETPRDYPQYANCFEVDQEHDPESGLTTPKFKAGIIRLSPRSVRGAVYQSPYHQTTKVFTVVRGGAMALEVVYEHNPSPRFDAQPFRVSPGQMFYIPPKITYRLENHSDQCCVLSYIIIGRVQSPNSTSR